MRVFRDMELVEQLGSGIPRILKTYGQESFYFSENFTRMSFPMELRTIKDVTEKENVGADVGINVGINELYELIKYNPGFNTKQLHIHFDVTSRTLERWLQELRSQNLIQFSGSKKTGGYFVVKAT